MIRHLKTALSDLPVPQLLQKAMKTFRVFYYPIIYVPHPEADSEQLFRQFVNQEDIVVEVGARVGGGTILLSELARYVFAFEPNRNSFRLLNYYLRGRKNVSIFNLAVGAERGESTLNIEHKMDVGYFNSLKILPNVSYRHREKVAVIPLDEANFRLRPTCIIIDCEGYELEVLQGARNIIAHSEKVLVETHLLVDGKKTTELVIKELKKEFPNLKIFSFSSGLTWVAACRKSFEKYCSFDGTPLRI